MLSGKLGNVKVDRSQEHAKQMSVEDRRPLDEMRCLLSLSHSSDFCIYVFIVEKQYKSDKYIALFANFEQK